MPNTRASIEMSESEIDDLLAGVHTLQVASLDAAREGVAHAGRKRVAVFVNPTRTASWDHRKLAGGAG